MSDFGTPNIRRLGQSAIVLDGGSAASHVQRHIWAVAREARVLPGVLESIAGAGNVTLIFDRHTVTYDVLKAALERAWMQAREIGAPERTVEIAVNYGAADGPDLTAVADACGLDEEEVIALHADAEYVVSFLGFLPGFAYLDGLDERLHLPRRAQPRTRVPAGSVAIAGAQSGVYPFESPGGWHVIGRTEQTMFDSQRDPAALLGPGDRVRFVAQ
jgi:5-oxoprolinase (ATP-hydrolysing) subunit B